MTLPCVWRTAQARRHLGPRERPLLGQYSLGVAADSVCSQAKQARGGHPVAPSGSGMQPTKGFVSS